MFRHWNLHGVPLSSPPHHIPRSRTCRKERRNQPPLRAGQGNPHWSPLTLAKCVRNSGHVVAIRGDSGHYNAQPASVLQPEPVQLRHLRVPTLLALWKTSQTLLPCQVMGMTWLARPDGDVCVCACVCMWRPVCRCAPPPPPRPGTCSISGG